MALVVLLLIPLHGMGRFNDLCMRACIPALMVLWVWVIVAAVDEVRRPGWRLAALGFVLALGSYSSLSEIWWSVSNYRIQVPPLEEVGSLTTGRARDQNQRAGDPDAFFFRHLARGFRADPLHPTR